LRRDLFFPHERISSRLTLIMLAARRAARQVVRLALQASHIQSAS
jgi:hypothetical protein